MSMQVDKKTVHHNRVVLGLVLAFGFAAQAFAGTSLSCAGYPKNVTVFTNSGISTFVQVCKIVPLTAPLTPSLSVTSIAGNVTAHGGQTEGQIPVYARIIAQDATTEAATALANSVNVSTERAPCLLKRSQFSIHSPWRSITKYSLPHDGCLSIRHGR